MILCSFLVFPGGAIPNSFIPYRTRYFSNIAILRENRTLIIFLYLLNRIINHYNQIFFFPEPSLHHIPYFYL